MFTAEPETPVIGSYQDDDTGENAGAAYLFGFNAPEAYDLAGTMSEDTVITVSAWSYTDSHDDTATAMTIVQLSSVVSQK